MCPFFVPKVIRNLVALLMYSERYWLINALSAHNPLGSVKGTGEKTCSFSQYVFSPLPVVQKTSGFYLFIYLFIYLSFFLLATFKGQKAEYLPSNAFKTSLVLMNVNSITPKSLTRDCSSISSPPVLTPERISGWPSSPAVEYSSIGTLEMDLAPYLPCKESKVFDLSLTRVTPSAACCHRCGGTSSHSRRSSAACHF